LSKQYLLTERQKGEVDSLEYQQKVLTELIKSAQFIHCICQKKTMNFS